MNERENTTSDPSSSACDRCEPPEIPLQAVLDSLPHPFYIVNMDDYGIRLANQAARQMHEASASTCYALTHGRDKPCDDLEHPCPIQLIRQTGQPAMVEHIHQDDRGRPRTVEVHGLPLFDEQGRLTQIIEYCVDVTEQRAAQNASRLHEETLRRRRLQQELLEIGEKEQMRVAQELHDNLGQQLTGIAIMSKVLQQRLAAQSPDEAQRAGELVQLISRTIEQTRQLSRSLHPVLPDKSGLMAALQSLATATENVAGVSCEFQCDRPVAVAEPSTAIHLYRIAQEAIANAIRHGRAKRIAISLAADKDRSVLSIVSDGRDFPKRLPKKKGGLQVMGYRAEVIGGILTVQKGPTGGTQVTCEFNVKPKRRKGARNHAAKDAEQH